MPASRKRKAALPGTAGSPAVATAAASAEPYNPLRDRELLAAAVQTLASAVAKEGRRLTAMEFCVEVLRALGVPPTGPTPILTDNQALPAPLTDP